MVRNPALMAQRGWRISIRSQALAARLHPRPSNPRPSSASVGGSGVAVELTCPVKAILPPFEFGAGINVGEMMVKVFAPNVPEFRFVLPLPSEVGAHRMLSVDEVAETLPPAELPVNCPTPPSVVSLISTTIVNAPKVSDMVVHGPTHSSVMFP